MTPLMWAAVAVLLFVGGALLVRALQAKQNGEPSPMASVAQMLHVAEPMRMRSQFDVETDEDLAVITDVYRDQRKAERARQALERLAPLVPSAAKK